MPSVTTRCVSRSNQGSRGVQARVEGRVAELVQHRVHPLLVRARRSRARARRPARSMSMQNACWHLPVAREEVAAGRARRASRARCRRRCGARARRGPRPRAADRGRRRPRPGPPGRRRRRSARGRARPPCSRSGPRGARRELPSSGRTARRWHGRPRPACAISFCSSISAVATESANQSRKPSVWAAAFRSRASSRTSRATSAPTVFDASQAARRSSTSSLSSQDPADLVVVDLAARDVAAMLREPGVDRCLELDDAGARLGRDLLRQEGVAEEIEPAPDRAVRGLPRGLDRREALVVGEEVGERGLELDPATLVLLVGEDVEGPPGVGDVLVERERARSRPGRRRRWRSSSSVSLRKRAPPTPDSRYAKVLHGRNELARPEKPSPWQQKRTSSSTVAGSGSRGDGDDLTA